MTLVLLTAQKVLFSLSTIFTKTVAIHKGLGFFRVGKRVLIFKHRYKHDFSCFRKQFLITVVAWKHVSVVICCVPWSQRWCLLFGFSLTSNRPLLLMQDKSLRRKAWASRASTKGLQQLWDVMEFSTWFILASITTSKTLFQPVR